MTASSFLADLDTCIFSVPSATTPNDKQSLLRIQRIVSSMIPNFVYLEIGSDQGGSLVPILADENCSTLISIDLRPDHQPDERGASFPYPSNGEEAMMANLRSEFRAEQLSRLRIFRADIRDVEPRDLPKVDLVLIDGEHTDVACFSDAERTLDFVKQDAVIVFHDSTSSQTPYKILKKMLTRLGIEYTTVLLPDVVGAIAIGSFADIVRAELGDRSLPREPYFKSSQMQRWIAVGQSMQERGLVTKPASTRRVRSLNSEPKLIASTKFLRVKKSRCTNCGRS